MAGVLFLTVKLIIDCLGSVAVEEIKSLWNVKDELEALEDTLSTIKAVLTDAEKRQIHEQQVGVWLERLEDAVYLADDLVDEISTEGLKRQVMMPKKKNVVRKVRTFFSGSNQLVFRHRMANKIKDVRNKLAKIVADRRDFHLIENMRQEETKVARPWRETRSFVPRENVIGRDGDKNAMLKLLLESDTRENRVDHQEKVLVIPIVGMRGLGKTTLAQFVFNDESVQKHFDLKVWVCVSDNFDEKILIEKIVKIASNMNTENLELEQLQNNLRKELAGKRYLLVLDDMWNENPQRWKNLKGLLTDCAEGSRIIVTTRSKIVAKLTSPYIQPYDLEILNPDDSWSLFKSLAFEEGQEQFNSAIIDVGKEMVKKCGGIPLAISMIGNLLYYKNPETDWPSILQQEFSIISQEDTNIIPTLKLSYDCLPSHLKHCFAYCRLFPKDYKIDVRTLVTLWIAQGFIKSSSHRSECLKDIGYGYFMELYGRSFFQEGEKNEYNKLITCKMHDIVHDLAVQVAGEAYLMLNFEDRRNIDKKIRNVSFNFDVRSSEGIPSSLLRAKRLRSILLLNQKWYHTKGTPSKSICALVVSNFKFLRMLDLHCLGIKILPNSIGKLKHLRYLDLSENGEMKTLPTCITKLVNLQTLKLNRCDGLNELPRDIHKLVSLRHLEIFTCDGLSHMPRGLSQLTTLQTLSQFVLSEDEDRRGSKLDELAGLNNLSGQLKIGGLRHGTETKTANLKEKQNLRSISFKWYGDEYNSCGDDHDNASSSDQKYEMTVEGLQPHPNLRELKVKGYGGVRLSSWLPLLTNLVNLRLVDFPRCQQLPPLNQFPLLKKMKLAKLPCLEYVINEEEDGSKIWTSSSSSATVLSTHISKSLQQLQLQDLPNLKGWWRLADISETQVVLPSFPCLSKLTVLDCPKLTCMPLYPNVETLLLRNTSWKPFEQTALISEITTLTTTEDQASSSSGVMSPSPLSNLSFLYLRQVVDQQEYLPDWMKGLTSLEMLDIRGIPTLKYLSPGIQFLSSLQDLHIEDCEDLIEISDDDSIMWEALTSLHSLTFASQQNLVTLPEGLLRVTTLQFLTIWECETFKAIPDWICNLCSLEHLDLYNCPNLKSLPASIGSLTSVQTLQIRRCPTLLERCQEPTGEDWPKIQHIPELLLE